MKILISIDNNVVIHADDTLVLTTDGCFGCGWQNPNFNLGNATVADATLPEQWLPGAWAYNGDWSVADQSVIDAAVAVDAEAKRKAAIPTVVSRAQFILALLEIGLLDEVEATIEQADRATQINYRERLEFERAYPLIATMAAALGKTDGEIDDLFRLAATL